MLASPRGVTRNAVESPSIKHQSVRPLSMADKGWADDGVMELDCSRERKGINALPVR